MTASRPPHDQEVARLLDLLEATERRLAELTSGETPPGTGSQQRAFVSRRSGEPSRISEASPQSALLDSLPQQIAWLDAAGVVIFVNRAWLEFGLSNGLASNAAVGVNYLDVCDRSTGAFSDEAATVAAGIRSVLAGDAESFQLEYPCHSPTERRWFSLTVTPLSADLHDGAVVVHTDISSRKLAELALMQLTETTAQRERLLTTMLGAISDFSYIFDTNGRFLFVNEPLLKLWGLTFEEAVGKNMYELGYPDDLAAKLHREIDEVIASGASVRGETPYVAPNGYRGFYEYIFSPVVGAGGTVEFVVGTTRDITERKSNEQALFASNQKFQMLADNITDVFWIRSADMSELHYLSPAFERIWGRTLETLHAHPERWLGFVVPEDRERVAAAFAALTRDAPSIDIEYRIFRPNGEIRWVNSRGFQVRDEQGVLLYVTGIVADITERQAAAQALRTSEHEFRTLAEALEQERSRLVAAQEVAKVGSWETDLQTMEVRWSAETHRIFETDPDTPTSHQSFIELVHPEERDMVNRAFLDSTIHGLPSSIEHRIAMPDGRVKFVEERWQVWPRRDNRPAIAIGTCQDITERKRAEAALRRGQKLEAVGQLAAGVAHEFNNILQTLMSMATLTRRRSGDPDVRKIAEDMETQIRRGADVTRQLLLSARDAKPKKARLDLNAEVTTASELFRRLIPENIAIHVETSSGLAEVDGDAGQLQHMLLNLAINARDAMPHGGVLTLRVTTAGDEVSVHVEDTGEGFDDATREHLFEPFFTTKDVGKGSGLGLAVVYGIVDQHGGRIDVSSVPGVGSKFWVTLPASTTPAQELETSRDTTVTRATGRILLVEDEQTVRDGLTILLEMIGYEVIAVARGEEAIALPALPAPDLLLSDVSLPGIGGPAIASILTERWPELGVLLMTGYLDPATRDLASQRGWQILPKPFEVDELASRLAETLPRKSDR